VKPSVEPDTSSDAFYAAAVELMQKARIPFLVGGAYALRQYTGIVRDTKDFDVFIRKSDLELALNTFRKAGYRADIAYGHWLAKVHYGEAFIDLIFRAGNGLCEVTDEWFVDTASVSLLGTEVGLVRPEDMISQKCYIMERERFDGADVAHLLKHCAETLDWDYLLKRFGPDWRVLLSHLVMFGFIYPAERARLPDAVLTELMSRMQRETAENDEESGKLCQGTLVSRAQYLPDIERWGYRDARLEGRAKISAEEIEHWTNAIGKERAWA
jgi:hypothetical protein